MHQSRLVVHCNAQRSSNYWSDLMDLRMQVYRCLATAKAEGLIDVVTDSETICKIQMNSASPGTGNGTLGGATNTTTWATTAAFLKKGVLCNWLKAQNQEGGLQALAMAQDQFTLSCAGYRYV